jgi:hypothetical protein
LRKFRRHAGRLETRHGFAQALEIARHFFLDKQKPEEK